MTETTAFALILVGLVVVPIVACFLARRGGAWAAAAVAAAFAGLGVFSICPFRPDLVAGAIGGTDLVLFYPAASGVPAVALLVALALLAPERSRRATLLFAGVVGAVAVWEAHWLLRDPALALGGGDGHWQGECYFQSTNWSCAPSAACSLLKRLGIAAEEGEMARLMRSRAHYGTNSLNIQRGLAKKLVGRGYEVALRCPDYEGLVAAKAPGIASIKLMFLLDHAVAVVEADADGVTVLDPLTGKRRLSRPQFEEAWQGQVVLVLPAESKK